MNLEMRLEENICLFENRDGGDEDVAGIPQKYYLDFLKNDFSDYQWFQFE
jgi:hypothetical protein